MSSFSDLKDDPHLHVLGESIQFLRDLSTQAAGMAQQLQDLHSRMERGNSCCMLNEESVISVRARILDIKTDLTKTAEIIPQMHTSMDVPWVGAELKQLRLVYLSGDDPWEFYLSYSNDHNLLKKIEETIKEKHSAGLLEKCPPKVGEFVACHQLVQGQPKYFRAIIVKYYEKLKKGVHVYKLDTGGRTTVFSGDVFHVPKDIVAIPSRVIKCCLLFEECDMKEKFGTELRLAFKDALEKCTLTVDILDSKVSGKAEPPHFSAVVWVFDETRSGADVNLNHWISGKVIPALKDIPQDCSDIFTYIQELDILDPFEVYETDRGTEVEDEDQINGVKPAQDYSSDLAARSSETLNAIQMNCVTSTAPVNNYDSDDDEVAASLEKVAEWVKSGTYARVKLPTPEPVVEPTFVRRKEVKNEPKESEQLPRQAQVTLSEQKRTAVEFNDTSAPSAPSVETRPDQAPPHKPARLSKYKSGPRYQPPPNLENKENEVTSAKHSNLSPAAPEFVPRSGSLPNFEPKCLVRITNSGNDEDNYDGAVTNLQDEYQPTDEKRICLFYQKNGYCGRKLCTKEHVQKSSVWTTDTILTYLQTFNDIDLPREYSEVLLTVQHIKSPVSFYATLPESYSDIGEPGALETSKTLHDDLNSLESNNTHPLLPAGPQTAELVIALGHQEYLGPRKKWLRARVLKVLDDSHVEVFFLDFGNKEVVKTKDLRQMRPQFLHLPAQAVLTTLSKVVPNPEKREAAIKFLKESIEQKELKANVISRYDGELEVQLYMENGESLNEILLRKNLVNVRSLNKVI